MSDYLAIRAVPDFIRKDAFAPVLSSGWSWGDLRNINYFIVNNNDPRVPDEARRHYQGVARFFRAYFYFEKVVRFGDVPWINKPLDVADEELYGDRDPRTSATHPVEEDVAEHQALRETSLKRKASGGKAILFSQWTKTIDWLAPKLPMANPLIYHGGIPTSKREPILDQFKHDPKSHLLLMSYGTGAGARSRGFRLPAAASLNRNGLIRRIDRGDPAPRWFDDREAIH